jgi:hypothetical protein
MRRLICALLLSIAAAVVVAPVQAAYAAPLSAQEDETESPAIPESPTALPKANSGRAPQQAGDRGGALQLAVLAIMTTGLCTIATVIVRSSRRHNRAITQAPPS